MDPPMGRQAADKTDTPLTARIFYVLAAVFLVGAVALASMLPPDMSLHEALHTIDSERADSMQHAMVNALGGRFWDSVFVPLLMRPVWLGPLFLGLICVGGAVSAGFHATPRANRRRS
jgi:hypothetical protein